MDFSREYRMLVNGSMIDGSRAMDVENPATGKVIAQVPDCTSVELDSAVAAARGAFPAWRDTPIKERQAVVRRIAERIAANADDIARLFTSEQGRPFEGALAEIQSVLAWIDTLAEMEPPVHIMADDETGFVEVRYVPLGVVCAIAPWNFPVALAVWKFAPALVAGNCVVLKPSPFTPLCVLKIGELIADLVPPGVLNIVSGGDELGPLMTSHPGFEKISFTGSSETGKRVMESAAKDLKRITLELGGNDAAIVMPDVDVDAIAERIFFGAFYNTAQICIATKRLYVHEDVYEALRDRLTLIAKSVKVGDGAEQGTVLGPIQNKRQYERVLNLLEDARASGLTLLQGADVPEGGYFIPITIVDNPPEDSRVVQEEAFGPILPMLRFTDVEDVIARANASQYGLAGAVWSKDTDKAMDIARRLETGTVWINQNLALRGDTPFAGRKQSGFGVENGLEGLLEYMAPQAIHLARS